MPTPSPICVVNGVAPPQNVTAGASVSFGLVSTAGANFWSVSVTGTDELNTVAAVQATVVLNQGTKTGTVTAPAGLGSAVQLTSVVGIAGLGLDANGAKVAAFTTTFKINVLCASGLEVFHTNETIEQSAPFGWLAVVNPAIRNASGGGGGPATAIVWTRVSTSPHQLVAGEEALVTVVGGNITCRTPVTPADAAEFAITCVDGLGAHSLTLDPNALGSSLNDPNGVPGTFLAANTTLTLPFKGRYKWKYDSTNTRWILV
jgi:hypothetical protein